MVEFRLLANCILIDTTATVAGMGWDGLGRAGEGVLQVLDQSWTVRETSAYCVRGADEKLRIPGHQI